MTLLTQPASQVVEKNSEDLREIADDDLRRLLLIRHFERKLLDLFAAGHIAGTTHTCLGQEYVPVALEGVLGDSFVFSNHRGHGHYLARFGDAAGLLAEITGRAGAVCGGAGGSQHILREGFCSTGVQGESVPAALGVALGLRRAGRGGLALAYVGDGTWGEGAVYEALNMASLWRAPLVLAVEHNGIAQSTPTEAAMAGTIAGRAAAFDVPHLSVTGVCVATIRQRLAEPLARVRDGGGPLVVEFRTHRLGPHSKGDDTRDAEWLARVADQDWYGRYARAEPGRFAAHDAAQRESVDRLAAEVLARPPASGVA
ncbi:thiamine pyrophosphate-dependent dehydrogenase E1 component subunit alpha [Streptomyces sp. DSM 44915]|uniref:Thiamine pyrophosphate-dependent dehydrogenase E1 component subunit alpha n=1 Tax=Streptomyces chisholmiae TaxID=3075540 RepID=A0ABU2JNM8_9ACTN|nr:thiamine pyrophosphate-dependent dehydrogenase E1 component subunit alpha [Streptomyces sp. DSM 44915]MDT0266585.1 thiamine pyrophosphate-dependent dehydrogenase E1 component subunit alpha [Streptomyces sp. DSM 44915]